ncbi:MULTISPECIES: hypothetical protein [unclassified Rhizobium]|uniref:hypothetical protein n=1 Tax=unclassified Rhizobium TaxID=2613769 RepID=UPI001ADCDF17|nr:MULTISPECIES: hypothetical protein [unclassified Rhizobium]MBO9097840.1 hypothetical protein [Rhizobium sp. L58/93]MBO9133377.1 hypothetical protein [Rhizobium sp. B209b/85]MBO9167991.1 hypothetical protein [Rhizobium sp. L245/93]MBO9184036.1 hypothetical protein [Rhizobium sp. E27B/91]QXZ84260.1 hypothetical protein J5287_01470 [Rhizobium sp. K1/93]
MEDGKHWYYSKTIWGALLAIGSSVLQMKGLQLGEADQATIVNSAVSIAGAVGGLLAVYGRIAANTAIKAS